MAGQYPQEIDLIASLQRRSRDQLIITETIVETQHHSGHPHYSLEASPLGGATPVLNGGHRLETVD